MEIATKICFVIPFFNEFQRIDSSYFSDLFSMPCDFILVDDGSTDRTSNILTQWQHDQSNVKIVRLPDNLGKAEAIRSGCLVALSSNTYQGIGFLDADASVSVGDVCDIYEHFISKNNEYVAFWKSRIFLAGRDIRRSFYRHYVSRFIASIFGSICPTLPYDTQCGLKVFKATEKFHQAIQYEFETRWFLDLEIYLRIYESDKPPLIWEIPCLAWREIPNSKLRFKQYLIVLKEFAVVVKKMREAGTHK
jgi:glycosyltransferase involved in cell wall biosynthesis